MIKYMKIIFLILLIPAFAFGAGDGTDMVTDGGFAATTVGSDLMDQETLGAERLGETGFETPGVGGTDVFTLWSEAYVGDDTIEAETTIVHGGNYAAKLTFVNGGVTHVRGSFSVTVGEPYKITYWTRGDGSVAGRFQLYDIANAKYIQTAISTGVTGTTYTQKDYYFVAPSGSSTLLVYGVAPSSVGSAYFDDVSIKLVTAPAKGSFNGMTAGSSEEITAQNDRDFSSGTIGNWVIYDDSTDSTVTYSAADLDGLDDKQGLITVDETSDACSYAYASLPSTAMTLDASAFYKITASVHVPAGNTLKDAHFAVRDMVGAIVTDGTTTVGDADYETITGYIYLAADIVGNIDVGFNGDPADGDLLYFDDVSIKKINTAWAPLGTNTMALVDDGSGGEALDITYDNSASGGAVSLSTAKDFTRNMVLGEQLKITFDAKINAGECTIAVRSSGASSTETMATVSTSSFVTTSHYYNATSTTGDYLFFEGLSAGEVVTIDNITVEPVTLDDWTAGNGWGPATDGAGAQVDKAYFYKGSGDLEQVIGQGAGDIVHLTYTATIDTQDDLITDSDNRDFAGGDIGNWDADYCNGAGTVTYNTDAIGGIDDKQGLVTSNGDITTGAKIDISGMIDLTANKEVRVSVMVYVPAGNTLKDVRIFWGAIIDDSPGIGDTVSLSDDTWTEITLDNQFATDILGSLYITFHGDPADGDKLYFDDVSIIGSIVPEIGGTKGDPIYAGATVSEDILASDTGNLKFIADPSIEGTIDTVTSFSEVTIHVDLNATGGADGSSRADAYTAIQTGVNDALGGDTVLVWPGTYTGAVNRNIDPGAAPNGFTIQSQTPLGAIVDGEGGAFRGFYLNDSEGNDFIIDGFKITNFASPSTGGGLYLTACAPYIKRCWFHSNSAVSGGAGLYAVSVGADPIIEMCRFTDNSSGSTGGAIELAGTADGITLRNVTITNNTATINYPGLELYNTVSATNVISYGNVMDGDANENNLPCTPTYSIYDYSETSSDTPGAGCLDGGSVNPKLDNLFRPHNSLVSKGGVDAWTGVDQTDIYGKLIDVSLFIPIGSCLYRGGSVMTLFDALGFWDYDNNF